jgi:hypothetical protein
VTPSGIVRSRTKARKKTSSVRVFSLEKLHAKADFGRYRSRKRGRPVVRGEYGLYIIHFNMNTLNRWISESLHAVKWTMLIFKAIESHKQKFHVHKRARRELYEQPVMAFCLMLLQVFGCRFMETLF